MVMLMLTSGWWEWALSKAFGGAEPDAAPADVISAPEDAATADADAAPGEASFFALSTAETPSF